MEIPDTVNGMFELFGGFFILMSIIRIHREKSATGVHWLHAAYFLSWGYWNLFYYPHLDQCLSFFGGLLIALMNTIWMIQLLYYKGKQQ